VNATPFLPLLLTTALLAAACSRSSGPALSESDPIRAHLSTNRTLMGEPFTARLAVRVPEGATVSWPAVGAPPAIQVRNSTETASSGTRTRTWELLALRTGAFLVWTGEVRWVDREGRETAMPLPALQIEVTGSLSENDLEFRDVTGLQHWPERTALRVLKMLGWVSLAAALLAAVMWAMRRRKTASPPAPPLPAHVRALAAIRQLRDRGWPDDSGIEAFYVELSAIVRRYLEEAFALHAPEQTTEEFIRAATSSRSLTLDHQQLVAAFLEQSDLVKFARHRPAQTDMEAALAAAERLVRETQPAPPALQPARGAT
jgi:hypothetical protein